MFSVKQPLSPHLQIYKPQITSVFSITHRATGVFLSFGALLFSAWLVALAAGEPVFNRVQAHLGACTASSCWPPSCFRFITIFVTGSGICAGIWGWVLTSRPLINPPMPR